MEMLRDLAIFLEERTYRRVGDEGLVHPTVLGGDMVGPMNVVDRHRLRAMRSTYPVCVREVDTDRSSGV